MSSNDTTAKSRMNIGKTDDQRTDRTDAPVYYMVATDRVLSGWDGGPDKSYVAYPVYEDTEYEHVKILTEWMERRSDFIRVRQNMSLPRTGSRSHCSLYDLPSIETLKTRR